MIRRLASFGLVASVAVLSIGCGKSGQETQKQTHQEEQTPPAEGTPATREVAPHAEAPHWGYEGETGPDKWGTLSTEWAPCGSGQSQSPIDIHETAKSDLPALRAAFKPAQLRIIHHAHMADAVNNGHTIQVNYTEGDVLSVGEEQFQLLQYHFHSPSEHTVEGKHYPMEMHLVHKSADGKLAVVGVFIEEGGHNAAFDPIWASLPGTKGTEYHFENVMVDVNAMLPTTLTSYRYEGSLTTPPCSEGVKWIIMTNPIQLSGQQIGQFQAIIKGNNRPVQPLNGRSVASDLVAASG